MYEEKPHRLQVNAAKDWTAKQRFLHFPEGNSHWPGNFNGESGKAQHHLEMLLCFYLLQPSLCLGSHIWSHHFQVLWMDTIYYMLVECAAENRSHKVHWEPRTTLQVGGKLVHYVFKRHISEATHTVVFLKESSFHVAIRIPSILSLPCIELQNKKW